MDNQSLQFILEQMGYPNSVILDFLDTNLPRTVEVFQAYKESEDSSNDAQIRWDASQHHDPIIAGDSLKGILPARSYNQF